MTLITTIAFVLVVAFVITRKLRAIDLNNRVVLITGASRGLGLRMARLFAKQGARLVICARSESELKTAQREIEHLGAEVLAMPCDVSNRESVKALIQAALERFGKIDVVVNNAGIIQVGALAAMSGKDFEDAMGVNFWGAVNVTLTSLPHLPSDGSARVVNITSIGAAIAVPHLLPYTCAKFAMLGFSEGLRIELAGRRIRVTTVMPGLMRTGSAVHAAFKNPRESKWFTFGANTPVISMNAERAARRIVNATRHGDSLLVLGLPAKFLRLFAAAFPRLTLTLMSIVNRILAGGY